MNFQLRIDFDTVLAQPRLNGNQSYPRCLDDVFRVNNIELCGLNTNQHSMTLTDCYPIALQHYS